MRWSLHTTVNHIPVYQFETVVVNPATKRDKSITDDFTKFRCRGTSGAKLPTGVSYVADIPSTIVNMTAMQ